MNETTQKLTPAQHSLLVRFPYVTYHKENIRVMVSTNVFLSRSEYITARALEKRGFVKVGVYGPAMLTAQGRAYVGREMSKRLGEARFHLHLHGLGMEQPQ